MDATLAFPHLRQVVLDATNARQFAEFHGELRGYACRPGDERPEAHQPDPKGQEWLVLLEPQGTHRGAFQQVDALPQSTWPAEGIPQQLHLDLTVSWWMLDCSDAPIEPLRAYADPAGHPFYIFVAPD